MFRPASVTALQDKHTALWHIVPVTDEALAAGRDAAIAPDSADALLLRQHLANFELWHEEDKAREPGASDARIAAVKRAIDRLNQRRHDVTELLDALLLDLAHHAHWNEGSPLYSETPGMMTDRLSILSLKIFHTQEEMARQNAPSGHRERNAGRLAVLEAQRGDLAVCLHEMWQRVEAGHAHFRLYKQLKMYNDRDLNPAMYGAPRA